MKLNHKQMNRDINKKSRFEIHIIEDRCKECGFCIEFCPNGVLKKSDKINAKGYHPPEPINPKNCMGCRTCELLCPDFAIFITPLAKKRKEENLSLLKIK
jgi:2-oxoglutarate ferredoxin oxidoreductase subunit delta